mgnify:CR=1 FL=1
MTICAALGWWGLLYPEFVFTPETVLVYEENTKGQLIQKNPKYFDSRELYHELLHADREDITFRSKIWEDLSLFWEAFQNGIE